MNDFGSFFFFEQESHGQHLDKKFKNVKFHKSINVNGLNLGE